MRMWGSFARLLSAPVLLLWAFTAYAATGVPMTKLNVVVTTDSGRPVDHAEVVVRFVRGHAVFKLKKLRTTYELRTNQDGEAKVPEIPQGEIRVQVNAKGYQTFGQIFDVTEEEKTIDIKLNLPQQQYSSHQ
jgi:hypothetical protein